MLPVAGLGSRFLPVTRAVPKEMFPLVDRPVLAWIVAEALAAGIERVVLVTSAGKGAIEDYFAGAPELQAGQAELVVVRLPRSPGLGYSVLAAREAVGADEPFAVLVGDEVMDGPDPALGRLLRAHEETGTTVVGLVEVPEDQTDRYGICAGSWIDALRMHVQTVIEKPPPGSAPSRWAVVGRYVCTPDLWEELERVGPDAGGEIQLTDALAAIAARTRMIGLALPHRRFDTGHVLGHLEACLHFAHARPELRDGVRALCQALLARADAEDG